MDCEPWRIIASSISITKGPVSGQRGEVTRWDHGTYTLERHSDAEWIVQLVGERFAGRANLLRSECNSSQWRVSFTRQDARIVYGGSIAFAAP